MTKDMIEAASWGSTIDGSCHGNSHARPPLSSVFGSSRLLNELTQITLPYLIEYQPLRPKIGADGSSTGAVPPRLLKQFRHYYGDCRPTRE